MCTDYIAYGSIGATSTVGLHAYMYRLRHVQLSMVKTNYWKIQTLCYL